jgi:hypothetical protein
VVGINTGAALASPNGTTTPEVGDIILKADYVADDFNFDITCVYHSEE